jgi:hypothetical protein
MARQRFDISSHWLLHNQGKGALLVGGLRGVRRLESRPGEIVELRKYPDGLFQVYLDGERKPHDVLIEVATYPEKRALRQALDDLTLAYSALGHLSELLMLVLRLAGAFRIGARHTVRSKLGLSRLEAEWKPVELWTLSATEFLAEADVGVVPWVPLMQFGGPPETLLERCAEKVRHEARPQDQADLLAAAQVPGRLKFPQSILAEFLVGEQAMFESPVLVKMRAETLHAAILVILKGRFKAVPRDVASHLRKILDEKKLQKLNLLAATCPDLAAFSDALLS